MKFVITDKALASATDEIFIAQQAGKRPSVGVMREIVIRHAQLVDDGPEVTQEGVTLDAILRACVQHPDMTADMILTKAHANLAELKAYTARKEACHG